MYRNSIQLYIAVYPFSFRSFLIRWLQCVQQNFPLLLGSYFWIIYQARINVYMLTPSSQLLLPVSGGWGLCREEEILQVIWRCLPRVPTSLGSWILHAPPGLKPIWLRGYDSQPRSPLPAGNRVSISPRLFCFFNLLFELEYIGELKFCWFGILFFLFPFQRAAPGSLPHRCIRVWRGVGDFFHRGDYIVLCRFLVLHSGSWSLTLDMVVCVC